MNCWTSPWISWSRSREGARIEIKSLTLAGAGAPSRSREGARIEMVLFLRMRVCSVRRSREGARIEISVLYMT